MTKTRVGVIGVGHLGQHHARLLASIEGVELVGVVDTNRGRADEIAAKYGGQPFADARELLSRVDAVTIAAPTVAHVELALPFLEAGIATLVEKPIASSVEEADRLLEAAGAAARAARHGAYRALQSGGRRGAAAHHEPRFIEIHRLGTFPERSLDIDVIFDLMIHDLDLLLTVVKSEVASIEAVGVNVLTPKADIANARLRFASGCIANITASRISRERVRKARFFQKDAYVSIDYAAQEVEVYRLVQGGARPIIQGGKPGRCQRRAAAPGARGFCRRRSHGPAARRDGTRRARRAGAGHARGGEDGRA